MTTETLHLHVETVGFTDLSARVEAALKSGRVEFITETRRVGSDGGFAVLEITARKLIIDLDVPAEDPRANG